MTRVAVIAPERVATSVRRELLAAIGSASVLNREVPAVFKDTAEATAAS